MAVLDDSRWHHGITALYIGIRSIYLFSRKSLRNVIVRGDDFCLWSYETAKNKRNFPKRAVSKHCISGTSRWPSSFEKDPQMQTFFRSWFLDRQKASYFLFFCLSRPSFFVLADSCRFGLTLSVARNCASSCRLSFSEADIWNHSWRGGRTLEAKKCTTGGQSIVI